MITGVVANFDHREDDSWLKCNLHENTCSLIEQLPNVARGVQRMHG